MSEAPETIWAWKWNTPAVKSHGKPAWSDFEPVFSDWVLRGLPTKKEWLGKKEVYKTTAVEYRRTDLPATDEQAFANEKVKALVVALAQLVNHTHDCEKQITEFGFNVDYTGASLPLTNARATLAAMEEDNA